MQIPCPSCGQVLEAPYPLPAQAKCPFCGVVFSPAAPPPAAPPPPMMPPPMPPTVAPPPYGAPPMMYPQPVSDGSQLMAPAICLVITGILWAGYAALNMIVFLTQRGAPQPPPMLVNDPAMMQGFEAAMKIMPFVLPIPIVMGVLVALAGIQMLRRRSYALALTGSVVAMFPCSPCCLLGLPFGIWSLVMLNKPEIRSLFS